ncbi:hypothetical protein BH11ACT4_BH11ACT4_10230 [soil metagenome]
MQAPLDDDVLARVLPGSWTIAATNFPMWLNGERQSPRFSYELVSENPLVLSDVVSFVTAEGEEKHIAGQDTLVRDEFRRRGKRVQRFLVSRWMVSGVSDDGAIAVIHFSQSLAMPSGIDIVVREGAEVPEVRATIARATEEFGLSPEEFGSLTWLETAAKR